MNDQEKAIYKTLLVSVSSGLNASLTPEDSRTLLKMLNPKTGAVQRRKEHPIDRIVKNISTVFNNSLNDLADDFEEFSEISLRESRRRRR